MGADQGIQPPTTLIPEPKTRLDRRVNRAYQIARDHQHRAYVWCLPGESESDYGTILISMQHPAPEATDGWVVVVDPAGYALAKDATAEEIRVV